MGTFCQKLVPLSTLLAKNIIELMISLLKVQFFATNGSDQGILKHYPRKFKNSQKQSPDKFKLNLKDMWHFKSKKHNLLKQQTYYTAMMGFFAPCTKSVIAEMRAVSPEQTQKMNHLREIDTLQKEKCV